MTFLIFFIHAYIVHVAVHDCIFSSIRSVFIFIVTQCQYQCMCVFVRVCVRVVDQLPYITLLDISSFPNLVNVPNCVLFGREYLYFNIYF